MLRPELEHDKILPDPLTVGAVARPIREEPSANRADHAPLAKESSSRAPIRPKDPRDHAIHGLDRRSVAEHLAPEREDRSSRGKLLLSDGAERCSLERILPSKEQIHRPERGDRTVVGQTHRALREIVRVVREEYPFHGMSRR